ncbi:MAG: hypothetical protein DWP97_05360 [Calditrichaeota bacterium]|nr:MAG: hypothetical protein DWP97_05360 [Calditrichota bacterium]
MYNYLLKGGNMIPKVIFMIFVLIHTLSFAWDKTEFDTVTVNYEDGSLKEQYMRTNHHGNEKGFKKDGQYRSWYQNGQLKEVVEYEYLRGMHGTYSRFYENGMKAEETRYINGKKHGLSIEWYQNHMIKSQLYYKNDSLNGLCKWYKEIPYNYSEMYTDSSCFFLNGENIVCIDRAYRSVENKYPIENKKLGIWLFRSGGYAVGKLRFGARHGKWTTYNERGEIIKQVLYQDGELLVVED